MYTFATEFKFEVVVMLKILLISCAILYKLLSIVYVVMDDICTSILTVKFKDPVPENLFLRGRNRVN